MDYYLEESEISNLFSSPKYFAGSVVTPILCSAPSILNEHQGTRKTQNDPKQFNSVSTATAISGKSSNFIILLNSKLNCVESRIIYQVLSPKSSSQQTQRETIILYQAKKKGT